MPKIRRTLLRPALISAVLFVAACSDDPAAPSTGNSAPNATNQTDTSGTMTPPANPGTADLPATGAAADVKAWLERGDYKTGSWRCEPEAHPARSPSAHGTNLICSNATLAGHGAGEYPVGSAAVKELYDGTSLIGRAMYRKLSAGGGESWYWYEDMSGSVVANDVGLSGAAKSICVGCHAGAGSDEGHSGHDFVYTQVK